MGFAGAGDGFHGNGVGAVDGDGGVDVQLDGDDVVIDDIGAEHIVGSVGGGEAADVVLYPTGGMELPLGGRVGSVVDGEGLVVVAGVGGEFDGDGRAEVEGRTGDTDGSGSFNVI